MFSQRFSNSTEHNATQTATTVPIEQTHPEALPKEKPLKKVSGDGVFSKYEQHKDLVIKVYLDRERRVDPTVRALKEKHNIHLTRQTLTQYLKKWGFKSDS